MLLIPSFTASAECSNNFTSFSSLWDPSVDSIVFGPQHERPGNVPAFQFIFPNLRFGCIGNLSVITVRVNTTIGQSPPDLFIWEDGIVDPYITGVVSYVRVNLTMPNGHIVGKDDRQVIRYEFGEFKPPLEVTERQFIGFKFNWSSNIIYPQNEQISHPIALVDVGEGNAPVSVYDWSGQSETVIQFQHGYTDKGTLSKYIPLISNEFGKSYTRFKVTGNH